MLFSSFNIIFVDSDMNHNVLFMKKIKQILILCCLALSIQVIAQDNNNPWVIKFGVNAIDSYPANIPSSSEYGPQGAWLSEFYNVDHWNVLPAISTIGVNRYLSDKFSLGARLSLNNISKLGDKKIRELKYHSIDGIIRYSLVEPTSTWEPFLEFGGGYTWFGEKGSSTFNAGAGLEYWFNDYIGLTYQANYKHLLESNTIRHFQHILGVSIKFGGIDTDGDGVYDPYDDCIEIPGLEEFAGCPDSDGDGIIDKNDRCPNIMGAPEFKGCPDTDSDGIPDIDDACPELAGEIEMNGCPDSDGDGINDKDDACPNEVGVAENDGCPWADRDNDGVPDKDDVCPDKAGSIENEGCPVLPDEIIAELNAKSSMILFKASSSEISGDNSQKILARIKLILDDYSNIKITIEGHTSSDGSKGYNQKLSEDRAHSVKKALESLGVNTDKISTAGYGEDKPIDNNNTAAGRKSNRRVQFVINKN